MDVPVLAADTLYPVLAADTLHSVLAADTLYNVEDSISKMFLFEEKDTLLLKKENEIAEPELKKEFSLSPNKAVIYAAIFPGLGQIYNRKYWKLPFVYGGFLGCAYAITWNGDQYDGYKKAYQDFQLNEEGDFKGISWKDYFRNTSEDALKAQHTYNSERLKRKRDFYRRYRDLSYIITIGMYAISIIDAYVDAQLFDFDISTDLSMRVQPVIYQRSSFNATSLGLQCSFNF
jgi:hypothetical protein